MEKIWSRYIRRYNITWKKRCNMNYKIVYTDLFIEKQKIIKERFKNNYKELKDDIKLFKKGIFNGQIVEKFLFDEQEHYEVELSHGLFLNEQKETLKLAITVDNNRVILEDIFPNNLLYDECVGYNITYYDEQEYNERELILKKYNEEAYIELTKKIYPALKQGIFLGQIISSDNKEKLYKISLPSTPNNLIMLYKVDNKIGKIILYKLSKINITIEYINDFL